MTYTINTMSNEVTRDADGKVVAPCQSAEDPDFVAYIDWVHAGNEPTLYTPPPVPVVPASITMRQARLALLGAGLLSGVDAAIDSMASPQREAAQIEWDYATEVYRVSTLVENLTDALGMTSDQIDALFVAAAEL